MKERRHVTLDAANLTDRESAHACLAEAFSFPPTYGRNLDALHDLLGELADTEIDVINLPKAGESARYARRVVEVLLDAGRENRSISVKIEER